MCTYAMHELPQLYTNYRENVKKVVSGMVVKSLITLVNNEGLESIAYAIVKIFSCEIEFCKGKIGSTQNWHDFKNSEIPFDFI